VAVVVLATFVIWELRVDQPMLQIRFFGDMRLTAASASITIAFIALTGMMFLVAQVLQFVKGYSPLNAALRVALPLLTINFIVMPLTPRIVERFGPKRTVTFGLTAVAIGLTVVSFTTVDSPYIRLLAGFALMATGFSLFLPSATDAIMSTLPREYAGSGSAINQTSRQAGQALGIAIGGSIAASGFRATLAGVPSDSPISGDLLERARESIAGSYRIAEGLDGRIREQFVDLANSAFVHGFRVSITVSAVTAIIGAIFAFITLPSHLPTHDVDVAGEAASDTSSVVEAHHVDDRAVEPHATG
jgi:MFS family permease